MIFLSVLLVQLDYSLMIVSYREINSIEDKAQLQKDLDSLQDGAENWACASSNAQTI